jgi:hypothetical protein
MNILCEHIRLRLDPEKRPGLLGIICNETTFWVHRAGVEDFVKDIVSWNNYVERNPGYNGTPSSRCFQPCVVDSEGPADCDLIYDFSADAVRAAIPLILNTYQIYRSGRPDLATRTDYILKQVATDAMASCGAVELTTNHIALGLLRYGRALEETKSAFPEGLDLAALLRDMRQLDTALERMRTSAGMIEQELMQHFQQHESYELEENTIVMYERDAQAFFRRLDKVGGSRGPTALHFLIALINEPSSELVSALSALQVDRKRLKKEAEALLGKFSPFGVLGRFLP